MTTAAQEETSPLQNIWALYDLQNELIRALGRRSWTKDFKEKMKEKVLALKKLLRKVHICCRRHVGGDDVLQAIEEIQREVQRRIGEI